MNMIKRYSVHIFSLWIILFFSLSFSVSCTYDYFEDETNYVVYVPKANADLITDEYRIEDIHIYIYNDEMLERQRKASFPFQENTRMKFGNFNFRLFPVSYDAFCFANTEGIHFYDMASRKAGRFGLTESSGGEYHYPDSFASFSLEKLKPQINYPGPLEVDTAYFNKRYSGRICIAFKKITNLHSLLTYNNIKTVRIEATGVGTFQQMSLLTDSIHTRSSSYTPSDKVIMELTPYQNPFGDFEFGIDGYFFPSLSDRPISLWLDFLDNNGNSIYSFPVDIPNTLHMNETIYLGTDGLTVFILGINTPEQWNPEIVSGGDEGMGI